MAFGSNRYFLRTAQVAIGCLLTAALAGVHVGQAGQAPRPQMAEDVFKNVPVIRGIPVDEFMDTMGMFSAALSLNCPDCHVPESSKTWERFADETDLKIAARRMVTMVNNINRTNFGGEEFVTCYTCHRGDRRPQVRPSLTVQYGVPMGDPNEIDIFPDTAAPPAEQILDKYIAAIGGAQRLAAISSFAAKGTYEGYDTDHTAVSVEIFAKAPNQRTTVVRLFEGNDSVRTFDGNGAWIASPDRPVTLMPLTGGNLNGARLDAQLSFPAQIKTLFRQWKVAAAVIDDREVRVVQGINPGQLPVNFYFDDAGLLIRVVRVTQTSVGQVPTEISYSDYREVAGVKMPFQWITTWTNGQTTTKLTEIQPNVAIDAARLARPAPARRPQ